MVNMSVYYSKGLVYFKVENPEKVDYYDPKNEYLWK